MGYHLDPGETLAAGLPRIASEQLEQALQRLRTEEGDRDAAVHEARKHFKKLRALLRLIREEIGEQVFEAENRTFRDAGRALSAARDSFVKIGTLESLAQHYQVSTSEKGFRDLHEKLTLEYEQSASGSGQVAGQLAEVIDELELSRARIAGWPDLPEEQRTFSRGLLRSYAQGRKRMRQAYAAPSPERFHEWRKRAKDLWYHTRILRPAWPRLMEALAASLHELSDLLGDDHDLAVLRQAHQPHDLQVEASPGGEPLLALIDRRREELQLQAGPLATRIYAEKPKAFTQRLVQYWLSGRSAIP